MLEGSGIMGLVASPGCPECFGISPPSLCLVYPVNGRVAVQSCLRCQVTRQKCVTGCCSLAWLLGARVQCTCSSETSSCSYLSASKHCFSLHEASLRQMVPVNILSFETLDCLLSNFVLMLSNWIGSIFFSFFFLRL